MVTLGVRLEDRVSAGFIWMFDDTKTMRRQKLEEKRTKLETAERSALSPAELFKKTGLYTEFDEQGVPTKLASGDELSKQKKKDLAKEFAKQQKDFEKPQKQAGADGVDAYLQKLRKEASDLEAQLEER